MALVFDGAYCGVDLRRLVKALVMTAGEVREKAPGPRAARAAIHGKAAVRMHRCVFGQRNKTALTPQRFEISIILHAQETILLRTLILAYQRLMRATQWRKIHGGERLLRHIQRSSVGGIGIFVSCRALRFMTSRCTH